MTTIWQLLYLLLWLFLVALLGRVLFDAVRIFARRWRPSGAAAISLELLYSCTDPPVKLFRRFIPSVGLGRVRFDLSIIVLFIVISIMLALVGRAAGFR